MTGTSSAGPPRTLADDSLCPAHPLSSHPGTAPIPHTTKNFPIHVICRSRYVMWGPCHLLLFQPFAVDVQRVLLWRVDLSKENGLVSESENLLFFFFYLDFLISDVEKCVLECRGWDVKRDRGCGEIRWQEVRVGLLVVYCFLFRLACVIDLYCNTISMRS